MDISPRFPEISKLLHSKEAEGQDIENLLKGLSGNYSKNELREIQEFIETHFSGKTEQHIASKLGGVSAEEHSAKRTKYQNKKDRIKSIKKQIRLEEKRKSTNRSSRIKDNQKARKAIKADIATRLDSLSESGGHFSSARPASPKMPRQKRGTKKRQKSKTKKTHSRKHALQKVATSKSKKTKSEKIDLVNTKNTIPQDGISQESRKTDVQKLRLNNRLIHSPDSGIPSANQKLITALYLEYDYSPKKTASIAKEIYSIDHTREWTTTMQNRIRAEARRRHKAVDALKETRRFKGNKAKARRNKSKLIGVWGKAAKFGIGKIILVRRS